MEDQNTPIQAPVPVAPEQAPVSSTSGKGNKGLLVVAGVIGAIGVIILLVFGFMFLQSKKQALAPTTSTTNATLAPTQSAEVTETPAPVSDSSDLNKYLNEVNSPTDTSSMEQDYNQAVSESSSL